MKRTASVLTDQDCADIAITAAEGGIGYWAVIVSDYDPVTTDDWDHGEWDLYYEIAEENEYGIDDPARHYGIHRDAIRRGWAIAEERGYEFTHTAEDTGDIDAEAADVIVQLAVFGKVVYS